MDGLALAGRIRDARLAVAVVSLTLHKSLEHKEELQKIKMLPLNTK